MPTDRERDPEPGQDAGPEPEATPDLEPHPAGESAIRPGDKPDELLVFDHGFVRLDDSMADDLSVVNGARVSFAVRKDEMDSKDRGLIRFLMREAHGSPFEHNAFRFHIRAPIFVAREWFRHRIGCLTGDTVVTFVNTNEEVSPNYRKTMDELWRMWSQGERNGHGLTPAQERKIEDQASTGASVRRIATTTGIGRRAVTRHLRGGSTTSRDARWRLHKMRLRVLNEDSNEFEVGHVDEVFYKGVQPVYRVTLADHKQITMTENHRILTADGWQTLSKAVGMEERGEHVRMTRECFALVNGEPLYRNHEWLQARRVADCHPRIHRTVRTEMEFARRFAPRIGFADVTPEPVTRKGFKLIAHAVRVVKLEYLGQKPTYDLSVAGPWHNFVANGVVVHNSFNEESARYHQLGSDFYVPSREAVRAQVGKPGAYSFEPAPPDVAAETIDKLRTVYRSLYDEYQALIERGVAKELARVLLPFGIYTQFYWTLNARSLMNFLSLRNSESAQYEIRTYAEAVERLFAEKMPITHECFMDFGRKIP